MRISDWSSDVCSSDLFLNEIICAGYPVEIACRTINLQFFTELMLGIIAFEGHHVDRQTIKIKRRAHPRFPVGRDGLYGCRSQFDLNRCSDTLCRCRFERRVQIGLARVVISVLAVKILLCGKIWLGIETHSVERLPNRSEEHTSKLQSLMRISYAVFCL